MFTLLSIYGSMRLYKQVEDEQDHHDGLAKEDDANDANRKTIAALKGVTLVLWPRG